MKRDGREQIAPLTHDDVLDAHDFLKRWHGPVSEIVTSSKPA